jgi:DNA-directed RNA polymerase subunit RPC12/RpoP
MILRRHPRKIKPLRGVVDVYKCLRCGSTLAVNADSQTFSGPPPVGCERCPGEPYMEAGRYYSTVTRSSAS